MRRARLKEGDRIGLSVALMVHPHREQRNGIRPRPMARTAWAQSKNSADRRRSRSSKSGQISGRSGKARVCVMAISLVSVKVSYHRNLLLQYDNLFGVRII